MARQTGLQDDSELGDDLRWVKDIRTISGRG
jgi:hypothetical protein